MTEILDFNFPFKPYDVQYNFMSSLYNILENNEIGLLESPTGTGKTLSLLCGTLKWLKDHERQMKENLHKTIKEYEEKIREMEEELKTAEDWITVQYKIAELKKELYMIKDEVKTGAEYEEMIEKMKEVQLVKKKKSQYTRLESKPIEDENLQKPPHNVDEEEDKQFALNEQSDDDTIEDNEDEMDKINYKGVKIFYSSRTHSQLNQVLHEIKKTIYAKDLRVVTLASRQIYCLNSQVKQLNSNELINEKCIDIQKLKLCGTKSVPLGVGIDGNPKKRRKVTDKLSKCEYYSKERFNEFKKEILCEITDVEDLLKLGKTNKTCPYYTAKQSIDDAQLILLPYQMLLNNKIRQQFGIDLKQNIVIIDEAHNLLDTLCDMHSAIISLEQLELGLKQLEGYFNKYMNRMKPKNIVEFKKLIFVLKRLITFFVKKNFTTTTKDNGAYRIITTVEMMCECGFGNLNLNEILIFCENTRIADKVTGFANWWYQKYPNGFDDTPKVESKISSRLELLKNLKERQEENSKKLKKKKVVISDTENVESQKNPITREQYVTNMRPILRFLDSLTEKLESGRILVNFDEADRKKCYMKYVLMKPNHYFTNILKESKSLILAGGTMQPTNEIINMLLLDHKFRVREYSFDHVVTNDACLPLIIKKGPKGEPFLFNYGNRSNPKLFAELATILLNVSSLVPHGIVCFFVSYDYLNEFHSYLIQSPILEQIERKKKLFVEPKNRDHVDKILKKYQLANGNDNSGALLFSVMGGKLSEGLNFSDNLGRCVIVIGMPYPNKNSPELVEKMKNYNIKFGNNAGNLYYENLCMKAVNQSIGRAIRHINDYASILLLDERYAREDILIKLPKWIRQVTRIPVSYGQDIHRLLHFMRDEKTRILFPHFPVKTL